MAENEILKISGSDIKYCRIKLLHTCYVTKEFDRIYGYVTFSFCDLSCSLSMLTSCKGIFSILWLNYARKDLLELLLDTEIIMIRGVTIEKFRGGGPHLDHKRPRFYSPMVVDL